ncbi:MAG: hypothetical protein JAY88_07265 [Candidatus Thiodiazotropha lotti]|nr:hypothetical protein [Candidatus Thiodiazotropha lotti]MCW4186859.1 hypothetical protein [Candidatus Thiodiazotropha lotti]
MNKQDQNNGHYPRLLAPQESELLLQDMKESSAWARSELKRRQATKPGNTIMKDKQ